MVTCCVDKHSIVVPGSTLYTNIFVNGAQRFELTITYSNNCNKEIFDLEPIYPALIIFTLIRF